MIGIGYILTKKGLFNQQTGKLFSKLILNITLPLMMIVNIPMRFSRESLFNSLNGIIVAFLSIIIIYGIAIIISYIFKIEEDKRGIFCIMFTFGNSIFIGLPINISLFGEGSTMYVFLYYFAHTTLFWTLGVYNIKKNTQEDKKKNLKLKSLKKIFSPPFIGFIIGIIIMLMNIDLPGFIEDSFRYIGSITTPLSMFFIGIVIHSIKMEDIKLDIKSCLILFGRFVVAPIIMFLGLKLYELPQLLKNVFIIESAMPIITQAALVAEFYDTDSKYVAIMVGFTTILSIIVVPIYSFIL
jgi:predicted permease